MEVRDVLSMLKEEHEFFEKSAKESKSRRRKDKTVMGKYYNKGKYDAYTIASMCVKDVIDVVEQVLALEEEAQ